MDLYVIFLIGYDEDEVFKVFFKYYVKVEDNVWLISYE